jgi:hypothetical protein
MQNQQQQGWRRGDMELPGVESWWEGSKLLPFKGGQCPLPHPKQVDCKGSPTPRWAILPQGIAW